MSKKEQSVIRCCTIVAVVTLVIYVILILMDQSKLIRFWLVGIAIFSFMIKLAIRIKNKEGIAQTIIDLLFLFYVFTVLEGV